MKDYVIEHMSLNTLSLAINWATQEGWNPGLHDATCFYQTDPHGFFVGKLKGEIISVASAVCYDENFAFCGFYIVKKPYRNKGYGIALTKHRLNYIGTRNAGIEGVVDMQEKYKRLGYRIAHKTIRHKGYLSEKKEMNQSVISANAIPFDSLLEYDARHFPAKRTQFLRCWIAQPESQALVFYEGDVLKGFGVIRPAQEGFKIGPLFADSLVIAKALLDVLISSIGIDPFFIDIPDNNPSTFMLINDYTLLPCFETARMYLKNSPNLPMHNIYGVTSLELG